MGGGGEEEAKMVVWSSSFTIPASVEIYSAVTSVICPSPGLICSNNRNHSDSPRATKNGQKRGLLWVGLGTSELEGADGGRST